MLYYEYQRKRARKIKYAIGKLNREALDKVSVMIEGSKVELTTKADIENACHQENKLKFAQTIGIPVISSKLIEDLGF